jgi:hypothetical protein
VLLTALVGLSGCNQGQTQASYRAEAKIASDDGGARIVTVRAGKKKRMEFRAAQGPMVQVYDPNTQAAYAIFPGQRTAIRISPDQVMKSPDDVWAGWVAGNRPSTTGACRVAGENGQGWTLTAEGGAIRTACVTADGIILRATDGDQVVWETTRIHRGPQDASQFSVPAGYRIVELSDAVKDMGPTVGDLERLGLSR